MKALSRVLDAIFTHGARHSQDVADITGMSVGIASAHASELKKAGLIRDSGRFVHDPRQGRRMAVWEIPGDP